MLQLSTLLPLRSQLLVRLVPRCNRPLATAMIWGELVHSSPVITRCWSNPSQFWPTSVRGASNLVQLGRSWPGFGRAWPNPREIRPNSSRKRSELVDITQKSSKLEPTWSNLDSVRFYRSRGDMDRTNSSLPLTILSRASLHPDSNNKLDATGIESTTKPSIRS